MKVFFKSKLILTLVAVVMLTGAIAVGLASHTLGQSHAAAFQPTPTIERNPTYAGYGAVGAPGSFQTVYAVWNVAPITCSISDLDFRKASQSGTWVGLANIPNIRKGSTRNDLEQVGTSSKCGGIIPGIPTYSAFWEVINNGQDSGPQPIDIPVSANDQISAAVTALGNGRFQFDIRNGGSSKTPKNLHKRVIESGDASLLAKSTAECIQERPGNGDVPLAHFSPVTFSCFANNNVPLANAAPFLAKFVSPEMNTGVIIGDTFTVTRRNR